MVAREREAAPLATPDKPLVNGHVRDWAHAKSTEPSREGTGGWVDVYGSGVLRPVSGACSNGCDLRRSRPRRPPFLATRAVNGHHGAQGVQRPPTQPSRAKPHVAGSPCRLQGPQEQRVRG
jgi:hypothetical protein